MNKEPMPDNPIAGQPPNLNPHGDECFCDYCCDDLRKIKKECELLERDSREAIEKAIEEMNHARRDNLRPR